MNAHVKGSARDELGQYFGEIANSVPLSREQEVALSVRVRAGDEEARDELVRANLRFVVDVAKRYQNRGLSMAELISAGNVGLITAAERFDGSKGFKFITYAVWWIKQSILTSIADHTRTVRMPMNRQSLLRNISKAGEQIFHTRGRIAFVEEIAKELQVSADDVADTLLGARAVRSLDDPDEINGEMPLIELVEDTANMSPSRTLERENVYAQLHEVLESLDARERKVLKLYFGLDGYESLTLRQIGEIMGVTRERVRQLKNAALARLRHPKRCEILKELLEA